MANSYLGTLNKDTEFTVVKELPVLLRQMVEVQVVVLDSILQKERIMNKNIQFESLTRSKWVNDKYKEFYRKNGYLPKYFDVYNGTEITDYAPTLSTRSNGAMGSGTVLIMIDKHDIEQKITIYSDYKYNTYYILYKN